MTGGKQKFMLLIAEALVRISIFMINDSGGKTNVFADDCRCINQNFQFLMKDSGGKKNVFAVDCTCISQNIHFYDKILWREEKCFCC
jgi:hypothetical protein